MAIKILTSTPSGLLTAIKKAIEKGEVETWDCDSDGDFTHNPPQWNKKAWLRPSIATPGELNLTIIWPKGESASKAISGVFQGRFVEMIANHFSTSFTTANTSIP